MMKQNKAENMMSPMSTDGMNLYIGMSLDTTFSALTINGTG